VVLTHGASIGRIRPRSYRTWDAMRDRCLNPRSKKWPRYGGRGITICERWHDYPSFLADMGEPPLGMTIERKNNDGNYEPENCIWADAKTQRSNRGDSKHITICGKRLGFYEACEVFGISYETLRRYSRVARVSYTEMFYLLLDRVMTGCVAFPAFRQTARNK
jgi:hypothetical protein